MEGYEKRGAKKRALPQKEPWEIFVSQGCRIRNVIPYCLKMLNNNEKIIITGIGAQVIKAISIAEIVKRKNSGLSQETEISYTEFEDKWDPKDKTKGLDSLCVTRNVPTITIKFIKNNSTKEDDVRGECVNKETLNSLKRELKSSLKDMVKEKYDGSQASPTKKERSRPTH